MPDDAAERIMFELDEINARLRKLNQEKDSGVGPSGVAFALFFLFGGLALLALISSSLAFLAFGALAFFFFLAFAALVGKGSDVDRSIRELTERRDFLLKELKAMGYEYAPPESRFSQRARRGPAGGEDEGFFD